MEDVDKMIYYAAILFAGFLLSEISIADSYVGIGYQQLDTEISEISDDETSNVGYISFGSDLISRSSYVAGYELRLGAGAVADEIRFMGEDLMADIDYVASAYVRLSGFPKGAVNPYVMIGMTNAGITLGNDAISFQDSDSSFSYVTGVDFKTGRVSLGLEYVSLFDKGGYSLGGAAANIKINF